MNEPSNVDYENKILDALRERPKKWSEIRDEVVAAFPTCRSEAVMALHRLKKKRVIRRAIRGRCDSPWEIVFSADDETHPQAPREVLIEIMAAHYVKNGDPVNGHFLNIGWGIHMFNGQSEIFGDLEAGAPIAVAAGWLAREISTEPDHGWPWDPARPVAGQYEEWLMKSSYAASHGVHVTEHGEDHASPDHKLPVWPEDQLPIPLDMTPPGHVELEAIGGDEPPSGVELEVLTGDEPDATVAL